MKSCFIQALNRQPVERTPVWLMRQAGRYMPVYRELRAKTGSFMSLCQNPELACEVTMQPLDRFDLDAAILFSDILTIPDAMGLGLYFVAGEGPRFEHPVKTLADIQQLAVPSIDKSLAYVTDAVKLIRQRLPVDMPLIGFSGSPWTLATYMVEGGPSKNYAAIKKLIYAEPEAAMQLLDVLSEAVTLYLQAQIDAGVNVVQIFDSWGGVLSGEAYNKFSLQPMQKIINQLNVPVIVFTKGGGQWLPSIVATKPAAIGLDWTANIAHAFDRFGEQVAIQGNLDPCVLLSNESAIRTEVKRIMDEVAGRPGHIFNLGHGILPSTPMEHVDILIDAVHGYKPE